MIPNLQEGSSSFKINAWKEFTNWGYNLMSYPIIVLFYLIVGQRWRSFYYILAWGVSSYIDNSLKMEFHNPRPYWVGAAVQAFSCSSGYGNPSGHAMTSMGRPLLVWLDY